jgi:hypothetical protein
VGCLEKTQPFTCLALEDLQAAAQLALYPEEHANISMARLIALMQLGHIKEAAKECRELAGHLLCAKDETTHQRTAMFTTPDFRADCARMISQAEFFEVESEARAQAEAESAVRAKDLYASAGALMAEGRRVEAAKELTEGYAC